MSNTDVIIVGGGLAGLTASIYLAKEGKKVSLFEKSGHIGGRAITQTKSGFKFNLGPHALYRGGEGMKVLNELDIKIDGKLPIASDVSIMNNGNLHKLPGGLFTLFSTTYFSSFKARIETAKLLISLNNVDTESLQSVSIEDWLKDSTSSEELRQLFRMLIRVWSYADNTKYQSAGAIIKQGQIALKDNVYYLDNGWQSLVNQLREKAVNLGVKIITNSNVEKIEYDSTVKGVKLADGTIHYSSSVIIAASPNIVNKLVDLPITKKWSEQALPVKAACLDLGLKELPNKEHKVIFGIDKPFYLSTHSEYAKLTEGKNVLVHVMKYLDPYVETDPHQDQKELEEFLDLVQPGWQSQVIEKRFLPKLTVANSFIKASDKGLKGRPALNVPGIKNLFICGDWVGNEGLLADASIASGKQTAKLILLEKSLVKNGV